MTASRTPSAAWVAGLALTLLVGCARTQTPQPVMSASEEPMPADVLAIASPTTWSNGWYRVRAEAWPQAQGDDQWHVLEDGDGVFRCETPAPSQTFVFASRESSAWVQGIALRFDPSLPADSRPTRIGVRVSPTPIDVSRAAWPAVASTLHTVGVADLETTAGEEVILRFSNPQRVSLVELDVRVSTEGAQCGMGRVALVPATLDAPVGDLPTVPVRLMDAPEEGPHRSGILGIDGASPLPRSQK